MEVIGEILGFDRDEGGEPAGLDGKKDAAGVKDEERYQDAECEVGLLVGSEEEGIDARDPIPGE